MAVEFPVATMVARTRDALPVDGRHAFEPKLDGWRCVAHIGRRVRVHSRHQRSLTRLFPDVAERLAALPPGTVLDGELVAMRGGRVDFTAMQSRDAERCLVAFDVLEVAGRDVRGERYRDRRARLEDLLGGGWSGVGLMPATDDPDAARVWLGRDDVEGVVAKRTGHTYRPGRRWWSKHRTRLSAEAIVGGVVGPLAEPSALILGRYDGRGRLRVVGRTIPLHRAAAVEVGRRLAAPRGVHPWPTVIPGGRLGLPGQEDVGHTPVDPVLVVELDVDGVVDFGRWRHGAKLVRVRPDLQPDDVD